MLCGFGLGFRVFLVFGVVLLVLALVCVVGLGLVSDLLVFVLLPLAVCFCGYVMPEVVCFGFGFGFDVWWFSFGFGLACYFVLFGHFGFGGLGVYFRFCLVMIALFCDLLVILLSCLFVGLVVDIAFVCFAVAGFVLVGYLCFVRCRDRGIC